MMIIEYLRYTINESQQSQFIDDYKKASIPLLQSPYCIDYELCQCVDDNSQFIIRISWTSADDHKKKFRNSDEFKRFLPLIKAYIADITEMRHYTQIHQVS